MSGKRDSLGVEVEKETDQGVNWLVSLNSLYR